MLEELNVLIRLQNIDNKLMEIEAEQGDLPEQIKTLEREINKQKTTIADIKQGLEAVQKGRREATIALEDAREQLRKSQALIYSVKTTREYDAISNEIEQAKNRINDNDRRILEFKVKEEELTNQLEEHKAQLKNLTDDYDERTGEMHERFDANREEEDMLRRERAECLNQIKRPIIAHYERIRKLRGGVGVSFINDNACSYCYSRIPPQRQAEVRLMKELILCETCGCVLVSENYAEQLQE